MKTKPTPKNKTVLRAGETLYDEFMDEYTVSELTAFSNKVVYLHLEKATDMGQLHYDCAMFNGKLTRTAEYMSDYGEQKTFYFGKEDATRANKYRRRRIQLENLGYNLNEIIKQIRI